MMENRYLFRGRRVENGQWIAGYLWKSKNCYISNDTHDLIVVDPATVGQCTGVSAVKSYRGDKPEDLLIYEDDIISFFVEKTFDPHAINAGKAVGAVYWDDGTERERNLRRPQFKVNVISQDDFASIPWCEFYKCEIIGTVHDKGRGAWNDGGGINNAMAN